MTTLWSMVGGRHHEAEPEDLLASIWLSSSFFFTPVVTASSLRLDSSVFNVLLLQCGFVVSFLKNHIKINLNKFLSN